MEKLLKKFADAIFAVCFVFASVSCSSESVQQTQSPKMCAVETDFSPTSQFDAAKFKNPPAQYRIVPFWSWNEDMQPDEIRRQLKLMKEAGWGGSMVHSRTGLLTDYLGEDWFRAVDACVGESKKLGMLVWLYDEDKWPSGFNGGDVLKVNEDFAVKSLLARKLGDKIPEGAVKVGEPTPNGIQVYSYRAKMGNAWFNGTSYVDTMSQAAMAEFKKQAYDSYYKRYKGDFGSVIVAEFTDEPAQASRCRDMPPNSVVYSSDLVGEFKARYGFDPVPHFYKLFTDAPDARKFRLQYYRTANALFERNFMKQLGDACKSHSIALTGHCMAESGLYNQQIWSGRIMPYYRHMGIPGIDHLARKIDEVYTGRQCSSVAHQYGKTRVLSELYGVSGGSLSFEDRYWIANQQFILGINQLVPHLSLYSMTGCRKRDFPQNINYQQSWWPLNSEIDVPLARACYALSQGRYAADILLISPQESMQSEWICEPKASSVLDSSAHTRRVADRLSNNFYAAMESLAQNQLTFDLGDEQLMQEDGFVRGKSLGIAQMSYKVVVVPEMENMRPSTLELLKKFAKSGGIVLRTADVPKYLDGEKSAELEKFFVGVEKVSPKSLGDAVKKRATCAVELSRNSGNSDKLWVHVRDFNDASRMVMAANLDRFEKFSGTLKIFGGYTRAQIIDIETGDVRDVFAECKNGALELPVDVERAQSVFVRVSKEKPVAKVAPKKLRTVSVEKLENISAKRLDDNSLTLDYVSFSFDGDRRGIDAQVPVLEAMNYLNSIKYDGDVRLKYSFKAANFDPSRKLRLVVEYPQRYQIKVNGRGVSYAGLPAWRDFRWLPIDITGLVKDGDNTVELYCPEFKYGDLATYKPQWRRYGTELEAVYLVGDFSVDARDTGARPRDKQYDSFKTKLPRNVMVEKNSITLINPKPLNFGDATLGGLPFYAGRLAYSATAKTDVSNGARVFVKLGDLGCPVAEVRVDGKRAGVIKFAPYELDITEFVSKPESKIEVVLYASLRNLADCPHNARGEILSIWPQMYTIQDLGRGAKFFDNLRDFATGKWKSKKWNMDYCQVSFGDVGEISVITRR